MPKRRWFQFHLSTLCFASLLVAVLLLLNVRANDEHLCFVKYENATHWSEKEVKEKVFTRTVYGWPLLFWKPSAVIANEMGSTEWSSEFYPTRLSMDVLMALLLVAAFCATLEYRIRSRETTKP